MPRRRHPGEAGIELGEEGAQVALHAVELGREVAHVGALDLVRLQRRRIERAAHGLAEGVGEILAFLVPVPGEIGLVSAEDVDGCAHRGLLRSRGWYSLARATRGPRPRA